MDIADASFDMDTSLVPLVQTQRSQQQRHGFTSGVRSNRHKQTHGKLYKPSNTTPKSKRSPVNKRILKKPCAGSTTAKAKARSARPNKRPAAKQRDEQDRVNSEDVPCEKVQHWAWASRLCNLAAKEGARCMFKEVSMFSEFTGSGCAESAMESVVESLPIDDRPIVSFCSMADVKKTCRSVLMATRR
jgi:hypothetical protein